MKFLIQKINNQIRHDFSFTLLESIRYQKWLQKNSNVISVKYLDRKINDKIWFFKPYHKHYVPIGSVEFVLAWMKHFEIPTPIPINIPDDLNELYYTNRSVINGNHMDIENLGHGKWFVKSATQFKGFTDILRIDNNHSWNIPAGHYQMSNYIEIESEWRAFVYQGKLVGLQNYSGDFKWFPQINVINKMIKAYKSAPIAYTLDIGINDHDTFIIEIHDFFSCGLYGFADHRILPFMYNRWFHEYLNKIKNGK